MKLIKFLKKWRHTSILRTCFINFKCLPFQQAIYFPIICSKCVWLRSLHGSIQIKGKISSGMITIGFAHTAVDSYQKKVCILNEGTIEFQGRVRIHTGVKLWVNPKGKLLFKGENVLGCNMLVACYQHIEIGYFTIFSWNCQLYDTNFHFYKDLKSNEIVKRNQAVHIGNYVLVGNGCTITKGVVIPDRCTISNCSLLNKSFEHASENVLMGGIPAKVLKTQFEALLVQEKQINDFSLEKELAKLYD